MAPIDDRASRVIEKFNLSHDADIDLTTAESAGFTKFVMSLMVRSPGRVAELTSRWRRKLGNMENEITEDVRARYAAIRKPTDPDRFEDYIAEYRKLAGPADIEVGGLHLVSRMANSEMLGALISGMAQKIVSTEDAKYELLTSDRPLVGGGPLRDKDAFLMLAISPRRLWMAAHTDAHFSRLIDRTNLTRAYNIGACRIAERYVYGTSDAQKRFVENHFPKPA